MNHPLETPAPAPAPGDHASLLGIAAGYVLAISAWLAVVVLVFRQALP